MLHDITWHQYFLTVILLLAGYYLVTVSCLYKHQIIGLLKGPSSRHDVSGQWATDNPVQVPSDESGALIERAHRLLQRAPAALTKTELIALLQRRLADLLARASPDNRLALFRYILDQSEAACGIRLTGDDLSFLACSGKPPAPGAATTPAKPSKNTNHVQ